MSLLHEHQEWKLLLPGVVEAAMPFVPGFDTDMVIGPSLAQKFYGCGYRFCLRYLSLGQQSPRDLTPDEAIGILNSGLALMPVQHVHKPGWSPSSSLGAEDGQNAATNAQDLGFPTGVSVWCDLEGVAKTASAQDVIDYCEAWYKAVEVRGYTPGLYVGSRAGLTGDQLQGLSFQHYWRSQSKVPEISQCGYQLIQLLPSVAANGISIDVDITQIDKAGGRSQWLRLAA